MKTISKAIVASLALLAALCMAVSACDDPWCFVNGAAINPTYGPINVIPGETMTLTAPSGMAYSWANYVSIDGHQSDGGSAVTDSLLIPTSATAGKDFGAVLTLTETHGTVSCVSWACIWLQTAIVNPPTLTSFCHGMAQSTDGFAMTMPDAAITYKWFIDGTQQTITLGYLNGLPAKNG